MSNPTHKGTMAHLKTCKRLPAHTTSSQETLTRPKKTQDKLQCTRCGKDPTHSRTGGKCPAVDAVCSFCTKRNHWHTVCRDCSRSPLPANKSGSLDQPTHCIMPLYSRCRFFAIILACTTVETTLHQSLPPRGWNSFDSYVCSATEEDLKENADFMAQRLANFGYEYVVVDYGWFVLGPATSCSGELLMDEYGRLIPTADRYPSSRNGQGFRNLTDYIHGLGLKFGIHVMRGIPKVAVTKNTPIYGTNFTAKDAADETVHCSWNSDMWGVKNNEAGQAYYNSLLQLHTKWGIDFIKMDCAYNPQYKHELEQMSKAVKNSDREIVLSLSPTTTDPMFAERIKDDVTMYRVNGDVWDNWRTIETAFGTTPKFAPSLIGQPSYPDLDMLPLGHLSVHGGHGPARQSNLTQDEQITLMTLWSIFRNPLIMGGDLPSLQKDPFVMSLLTNKAVLEMNNYGKNVHAVNVSLIRGGMSAIGLDVIIQPCQSYASIDQRWTVNKNGTITSQLNGYCLSVYNVTKPGGADIRAMPCKKDSANNHDSVKNQVWSVTEKKTIKALLDGYCLDVSGFTGANVNVDAWQCNGGDNQKWTYWSDSQQLHSHQHNANVCLALAPTGHAWASHGRNGEIFVALFNLDDVEANVTVALTDIDNGRAYHNCTAQDMWAGKTAQLVRDHLSQTLPPHGSSLYNITQCYTVFGKSLE